MPSKLVPESPDKTQQHVNSLESSSAFVRSFHRKLHPVYQLQRALGNGKVARLIQTKQLTPAGKIIGLQRTLTAGTAHDRYMQEADRVARRAMYTADAAASAGVMTAGFWGCLFGQLGGCQPVTDPNAREVTIDHRTSGTTSDENKCTQCPRDLGVLPGVGRNGIELRGTVNGYVPGVKYDFKRERKGRTFERIDGLWRTLIIPGKDDDTDNSDEFLTPVNGHIYAVDQPGAFDPQDPCDPAATEFVQKLSMTEWVIVRKGAAEPWERGSDYFYWHSIVWLRKVDGVWKTDMENSEIGPGTINVDTKEP